MKGLVSHRQSVRAWLTNRPLTNSVRPHQIRPQIARFCLPTAPAHLQCLRLPFIVAFRVSALLSSSICCMHSAEGVQFCPTPTASAAASATVSTAALFVLCWSLSLFLHALRRSLPQADHTIIHVVCRLFVVRARRLVSLDLAWPATKRPWFPWLGRPWAEGSEGEQ